MRPAILLVTLCAAGLGLGLVAPRPAASPPRVAEWPGLHNVRRVLPGLLTGSLPEGAAGWESLRALGIRTVVSVDGLPPDAELARQYGVRPVHVPVGYDGVPRPAALTAARAVRDLPGPVYLHCHHGQHRGPAVAVAAALCLDPAFTPADGQRLLRDAGTGANYPGLIAVPTRFVRPSRAELDAAPAAFPARADVPDLAARMVEIDRLFDRVKSGGAGPADATALAELLRESARLPSGRVAESGLAAELDVAASGAERLARPGGIAVVGRSCTSCHARHRDAFTPGLRQSAGESSPRRN